MHGTGYYWNRLYKMDYQTDEYAVVVCRLYYYYYEAMSDCYEPTYRACDEYEVTVIKWEQDYRIDRKGGKINVVYLPGMHADHRCPSVRTGSIGKDEANKILWNIKNRNVTFEDCRKYFTELAGWELKA